jgi:hypothetical protein
MCVEYQCAVQKLCAVNISMRSQNCARWVLARDIKVVRTSYWHDREVIHSGFKVQEARFTLCYYCTW